MANSTEDLLTQARADEVYAQYVASGQGDWNRTQPKELLSQAEQSAVNKRWGRLPGYTCWMDAFCTFLSDDKIPPYMQAMVAACKRNMK